MSSYRTLPPKLDGRLVAALARLPEKSPDRRRLSRPGGRFPWMSLIVSGITHVVVMLAVSATVIVTVEVVRMSALVCEIPAETEPSPLESLDAIADGAVEDEPEALDTWTLTAITDASGQIALDDPVLEECPLADAPRSPLLDFPIDVLLMALPNEDAPNSSPAEEQARSRPKAAEYFGTVARGDRFVYVLDHSGSMSGERFQRAAAELLRSLDQLDPDQLFYVVLFSHVMRRMFDDADKEPHMLPATPGNRQRLRKWLESITASGGTDPKESIRFAMSLRPSAVFLLSDGEFNGITNRSDLFGVDSPAGEIIDGSQGVPIHSFAYEDPNARRNMQTLAAMTGGQYRYIEPRSAQPGGGATSVANARPAGAAGVAKSRRTGAAPLPQAAPAQPQAVTPWQQADAMLKDAERLADEGNLQGALLAYRNLVQQYPMTPAGAKARGRMAQLWNAVRMGRR